MRKKSSNERKVQLKSACTSSLLMKVTTFMEFQALEYIFYITVCMTRRVTTANTNKVPSVVPAYKPTTLGRNCYREIEGTLGFRFEFLKKKS